MQLPLAIKIALLRTVKRNVGAIAEDWVRAACRAKGLRSGSPIEGEEWVSGPWALCYALERYLRTLRVLEGGGAPRRRTRRFADRTVVEVFPNDVFDRFMLRGVRAEVWTREASWFGAQTSSAGVTAVLGAGNVSSIAPLDALHVLFNRPHVCAIKMHPVNAYLRPMLEAAFEPFVKAGFVRFIEGGAETGAYLCGHALVDDVHLTGSIDTYRAVVREARGKPVMGELGNVSPCIVIPGDWSDTDLQYQAEHIATQKAHNAGFNCIAAQVLVLPKAWKHTAQLKSRIQHVLRTLERRPEYYPGATERRVRLAGEHSRALELIDVDADAASPLFESEAFCGILACVELPGDGETYMSNAVAFANERLAGTLGATVIADERTLRHSRAQIDAAVEQLRYGCVGVNAWTGVGYFLNEAPWKAYDDTGTSHNAAMIRAAEKTVVYAPFKSWPKPAWFVTNRNAANIGRSLCAFELDRTASRFADVVMESLKG